MEDAIDTPLITTFSFSKCKEVTKKLSLKPVAFTDPVEAKDGFLSFVGRVIRKNSSNLVLLSFKKEQIKINTNMKDEINVEENKVYEFCLLKKKKKKVELFKTSFMKEVDADFPIEEKNFKPFSDLCRMREWERCWIKGLFCDIEVVINKSTSTPSPPSSPAKRQKTETTFSGSMASTS